MPDQPRTWLHGHTVREVATFYVMAGMSLILIIGSLGFYLDRQDRIDSEEDAHRATCDSVRQTIRADYHPTIILGNDGTFQVQTEAAYRDRLTGALDRLLNEDIADCDKEKFGGEAMPDFDIRRPLTIAEINRRLSGPQSRKRKQTGSVTPTEATTQTDRTPAGAAVLPFEQSGGKGKSPKQPAGAGGVAGSPAGDGGAATVVASGESSATTNPNGVDIAPLCALLAQTQLIHC